MQTDRLTSCNDPFDGNHVAEMGGTQSAWIDMMVTETATEPNVVCIVSNIMLFSGMMYLHTFCDRVLECGNIVGWMFEESTKH